MATSPRVYRPSYFLHLQIRLEDFAKDETTENEAFVFAVKAKKQAQEVDRLNAQLQQAKAASSQGGADGQSVQVLQRKVNAARRVQKSLQSAEQKPRAQKQGDGDEFSISLYLVPTDCTVEMNSFRIADTMQASFPFIDAPFISDVIRACVVEVWAGSITPEDFAAPDRWRLRRDRSTILFRGWVDSWDTSHDDTDAKVQIQARSYESILMDAKINPRAPVYKVRNGGERISTYLDRILSQFPATKGGDGEGQLRTMWYGADPTKEPLLDRKAFNRSMQTAASRNASAGASADDQHVVPDAPGAGTPPEASTGDTPGGEMRLPPKSMGGMQGSEMAIWDLFTQACRIAGCIPIYDPSLPANEKIRASGGSTGDFILLRPAQTIFEDVNQGTQIKGGAIDGFKRRFNLPSGSIDSDIRFLVWGHNVKSFKTARKLGRVKVLGIEVISHNADGPAKGRTISVRFPPDAVTTRRAAKGEAPTHEIQTIEVNGIRDEKMLLQTAVSAYHAISRQEVSVSIETDDLASYIDPTTGLVHNDELDMLRLRPGSPCRVAVAREVKSPSQGQTLVVSPLSEIFERREDVLYKMLQKSADRFATDGTGFFAGTKVEDMQRRVSRAMSSSKLTEVFYCRAIRHTMTADEGWSASVELVNYIAARVDPVVMAKTTQQANDERKMQSPAKSEADKYIEAIRRSQARSINQLQGRKS